MTNIGNQGVSLSFAFFSLCLKPESRDWRPSGLLIGPFSLSPKVHFIMIGVWPWPLAAPYWVFTFILYFPFTKWNSVTAYDLWLDLLIGSDWLKWRHNGTLECMTAYLKPWTWTWLMTQLKWVNMWKKRKREKKRV